MVDFIIIEWYDSFIILKGDACMTDLRFAREKADYAIATGSCFVEAKYVSAIMAVLEGHHETFAYGDENEGYVTIEKVSH